MIHKRKPRRKAKNRHEAELFVDVEQLESRQMLAGNVSANITGGGDLVISGDGDANSIEVAVDASGTATIIANDGENLNLGNLATANVTGDVRITMRGGDDTVYVSTAYGASIDQLRINAGAGDDYIQVEDVDAPINIIGGAGDDSLAVKYSYARGSLSINGGSGNDDVSVFYAQFADSKIITGSGNDSLTIAYAEADDMRFSLGGGNDDFTALKMSSGDIAVTTSSGDDTVKMSESSAYGELSLRLGGGDDYAEVGDTSVGRSYFRSAKIDAGGGSDTVTFKYADVSSPSTVRMGGGNDQLNVLDVELNRGLTANGGGGEDGLSIPDTQDGISHVSFEQVT